MCISTVVFIKIPLALHVLKHNLSLRFCSQPEVTLRLLL